MNKITKSVDPIQRPFPHSDSDLSLQLSDASSLSSDSDLSDAQQKKKNKKKKKSVPKKINKKKKVKDDIKYCTCRKGYDGKEFMIECDGCQEWFHGACVGLKPNSVTDHYYCKSCLKKKQRKKSIIILPLPKPEIVMPVISKLSIDQDDEDEDLCPVCDGDCTCGSEVITPSLPPPPPPPVIIQETPKIVIKKTMPATKSKKSKKPKKTIPVKHNISSSDHSDSSSDSDDSIDESDDNTKRQEPKKKTSTPRRGKSTTLLANIIRQKAPHYGSKGGKKSNFISNKLSSDEDTDEEVVVDDLDDLLETMSPLSEHSSNESNHSSEEFFTDDEEEDIDIDSSSLNMSPYPESRTSYSSVHIDSGDDEDIENAETQAIIADMQFDSDEEEIDSDEGMFIEDEEDDDDEDDDDDDEIQEQNNMLSLGYYTSNNNHWSSDEDEDEEEEEFDYTTVLPNEREKMYINPSEESDEEKQNNAALLPLLDSEGNLYDSIASAFMQSLGPMSDIQGGDTTHGNNTPALGEEYQLSPFELAHALSTLSAESVRQHGQDFLRRPSLPSNAVSAAQRNRGSQDFNTSEALRALSALASEELSIVPLEPIHEEEKEIKDTPMTSPTIIKQPSSPTIQDILPNQLALSLSTDLKLQEQILDILKGSESNDKTQHTTLSLEKKSLLPTLNTSRQILPKPSGSGIGNNSFPILALEQQIQDALKDNLEKKRKNSLNEELNNNKKRRLSRSNSLGNNNNNNLQQMETDSFSTPASPAAIIDELEDLKEKEAAAASSSTVSMDDLVDTSQLYTRSLSRSPSPEVQDDPYSRDLSRWQRIPIGAFRLMRSKNKLWLER